MTNFDSFFGITRANLNFIGLELFSKPPATKCEKATKYFRIFRFWYGACCIVIAYIFTGIFLSQNGGDLEVSGSSWCNFFMFTIILPKTFHLALNRRHIEKLMERIKNVYDLSSGFINHRYERNLKINNAIQRVYIAAVCGADFTFFTMAIIQNVIAIANGANHWERIFSHEIYFPFNTQPMVIYICVFIWLQVSAIFNDFYITTNEILFDTLVLMISMEFDNLADEFERFNYKLGDKNEFKKLVDRHNELIDISKEMNSIYNFPIMVTILGSSVWLCFSLFQSFILSEKLITPTVSNITSLIKFSAYLNASLLQILLLSYFCEKLRSSSENVARKIMMSNWQECCDKEMAKNILIVLANAQKSIELTGLNFVRVNMETFTNTVSAAWSYFSVLKSSR